MSRISAFVSVQSEKVKFAGFVCDLLKMLNCDLV
jgi:hypothetical protein